MKDRISADVRRKFQEMTTRKEVSQVLTDNSTNRHYERIMMALASKNIDLESEREKLATFLHIIEDLQKSIRLAAQESHLSKNILNSLRKKMDSLDAQYGKCQAKLNGSGKAKKYLVNLKSEKWWESEDDPDLDEDDKSAKTSLLDLPFMLVVSKKAACVILISLRPSPAAYLKYSP
ncbi:hypothetical protein BFJ63_vAg17012 [Fusarium oxysporum f. sp. narcissi]|uniref:Uncharacterized protein n=1 Tax=Fusarium oxysporum f. sp. narcissi TaxID=451672 RepID=A0A4Q2V604_FUSOX|nr:hypothetical protein BFJ63_vAg17012 [Fusarium oxysporum f. sp. narcissi]